MATIREIAKMANVSVATVSRVIHGNGYVREETKKNAPKNFIRNRLSTFYPGAQF